MRSSEAESKDADVILHLFVSFCHVCMLEFEDHSRQLLDVLMFGCLDELLRLTLQARSLYIWMEAQENSSYSLE